MILSLLFACVKDTPLPDVGPCADYPEGVYEYGQIGINTCLSGPTDIAFLDDGHVLAVTNANPWLNFTGGSALFLDLDRLEPGVGRTLVSDIAADALDMPSFTGGMDLATAHDTLVIANRKSEGARTREATDDVWFVDVTDPRAPAFANLGWDGGPSLPVGYDPTTVHYDAANDIAWVINRTSHEVAMLDLSTTPVTKVAPGGPGRLAPDDFVDVDGDGSHASFVSLEPIEAEVLTAHDWDLRWNVGTVRVWIPTVAGARRMTGNGEALWEPSAVPDEIDLVEAEGQVIEIGDPTYLAEDTRARMFFADQGGIRAAAAELTLESWSFEAATLLEPREGEWDATLGGPSIVVSGVAWYLFYEGTDGTDTSIGVALSEDGANFSRVHNAPIVSVPGVSVSDPFVLRDVETNRWRMFFSTGTAIGQAESDDLTSWTVLDDVFPVAGGAYGPVVEKVNGRFRMMYTTGEAGAWRIEQAVSIDGYTWEAGGEPFALDAEDGATSGSPPTLALQVSREETFRLANDEGDVFPLSLVPGSTLTDVNGGWSLRVAAGQWADPDDIGAEGIVLDAWTSDGQEAVLTVTGTDGVERLGGGVRLGDTLLLDDTVLLDPDDIGADAVRSAVVADVAGVETVWFAWEEAGVTSIGRATVGGDGTWTVDDAPVLEAAADWESVAMEPGSAQVLDDGTIRLWYSGFDGATWRVGVAESADGVRFTRVSGPQYAWTFDGGGPGDWDDSGVRHPYVVREGGTDHLWFAGTDGATWQIGYASREGEDDFVESVDMDDAARPVLQALIGAFGAGGVLRPVVLPVAAGGWEITYTGLDEGLGRVGRAVALEPDRVHRDLRLPSLSDTWGFVAVPEDDAEAISLDVTIDGGIFSGIGCAALTTDPDRGFLYVGCKLRPYVFVIDTRQDGPDDLNYLDVEAVILLETSTSAESGLRSLSLDTERGWLWGVAGTSTSHSVATEALFALDVSGIEDNGSVELVRENIAAMLPLPRSNNRDQGVDTQAFVGPAQIALHPDGHHLFVTNFNDNSISVYDLALGGAGQLVAEARNLAENPYSIRISPDGTRAVVGFYAGTVAVQTVDSSLGIFDADPTSDTFLAPLTWVVNK